MLISTWLSRFSVVEEQQSFLLFFFPNNVLSRHYPAPCGSEEDGMGALHLVEGF